MRLIEGEDERQYGLVVTADLALIRFEIGRDGRFRCREVSGRPRASGGGLRRGGCRDRLATSRTDLLSHAVRSSARETDERSWPGATHMIDPGNAHDMRHVGHDAVQPSQAWMGRRPANGRLCHSASGEITISTCRAWCGSSTATWRSQRPG